MTSSRPSLKKDITANQRCCVSCWCRATVAEGLQRMARAFFETLDDPNERERRKVTIQIWAEALRDKRIRKIVERGIRQRDLLTAALRNAQLAGQLPEDLDTDAFSRVLLALVQGFILQQAWEPELDTKGYLTTAMRLVNTALGEIGSRPHETRTRFRKSPKLDTRSSTRRPFTNPSSSPAR